MPICTNEAVDVVNRAGFDFVRVPSARIQPMDLIIKHEGRFVRYSNMPSLWESEVGAPSVNLVSTPDLSTVRSTAMKGKLGLAVLFQTIGRVGLSGRADRGSALTLEAKDCTEVSCDHAELSEWIRRGDYSDGVDPILHEPDTQAWVITSVLQSKSLTIEIGAESDAAGEVTAADLTKTIEGQIEASRTVNSGSTIVHDRDEPVTFGFKSAGLKYDGLWLLDLPDKAGKKYLGHSAQASELLSPAQRIELDSE
ncbi:MAG: hypothetical protein JJ938_03000 [Roseicyclus sp.]|nr:hypothetical protein [Roseicyclus sp.]MBO6922220.1 hypothetical protein [Roseicyclus sp.]